MSDLVERTNRALEAEAPALYRALSPLGRRIAMPQDIPVQAGQARGKTFNGTIGQITDGRGNALPLPSMRHALETLGADDLNRAFLYSPVPGIPELRQLWRRWQLGRAPGGSTPGASSLPVVTDGLCHSLSLVADLFAGDGRVVATASPFWGNYRQTFATRTGARMVQGLSFRDGSYHAEGIEEALAQAQLPPGEPAVAIVNQPSNPGGYSPTKDERRRLRESLLRIAEQRPLVVVCDDAYAGLVYEDEIPRESMYWELIGLHEQLIPIKVDGATKEFSFFGGRVGFLTFPFEPGSAAEQALESKVSGLLRATVGSPVAASQVILLKALRDETASQQVEAVRAELERRYRVLREALGAVDTSLLNPQPFNAGCFALVEIPETVGVSAEQARLHLLEHHDTGLVSLAPRYLRIAHCSVSADLLPELVRRMERGVRELAK